MARPEPTPQSVIDEWLAKGNEITQLAYGERSEEGTIGYTHGWGRKKKTAEPATKNETKEK